MKDDNNELIRQIKNIADETSSAAQILNKISSDINPFIRMVIQQQETISYLEEKIEALEKHKERHCEIVERGKNSLVNEVEKLITEAADRKQSINDLRKLAFGSFFSLLVAIALAIWNHYQK